MKHLPKHLRPRWRYLAVDVESWPDAEITDRALQRELWYAAQNLFGDPGSASLDLRVLRFAVERGRGHAVVRTRRGEVERARAAIACLTTVEGAAVRATVRGVSGTVRACEERYIRRPTEPLVEQTVAFEDADRPAVVRSPRVDVRVGDGFAGATTQDT
jgi:ribonuclease P/MRP protein subunit POP5